MKLQGETEIILLLVLVSLVTSIHTYTFCVPDKVIENAKEIDYSNYPSTGNATVICNDGYTAKPSSTMVCLYNQWAVVECVPIDCSPILPPANGTVEFSNNSTTYLAVASFFCNEGFELNGASNRTCLANGNWSSSAPDCSVIDCGTIYPLHYGFVNFSGRATAYKEKIAVTCAKGYMIEGDREITCLGNGTWSRNTVCKLAQESAGRSYTETVLAVILGLVIAVLLLAVITIILHKKGLLRWLVVKKIHYRTNIEFVDKGLRPASALDTKPATN